MRTSVKQTFCLQMFLHLKRAGRFVTKKAQRNIHPNTNLISFQAKSLFQQDLPSAQRGSDVGRRKRDEQTERQMVEGRKSAFQRGWDTRVKKRKKRQRTRGAPFRVYDWKSKGLKYTMKLYGQKAKCITPIQSSQPKVFKYFHFLFSNLLLFLFIRLVPLPLPSLHLFQPLLNPGLCGCSCLCAAEADTLASNMHSQLDPYDTLALLSRHLPWQRDRRCFVAQLGHREVWRGGQPTVAKDLCVCVCASLLQSRCYSPPR